MACPVTARGAAHSLPSSTASGKVLVRAVNAEVDSFISSMGPKVAPYAAHCEANGLPRVKLYDLVRECSPLKIKKATKPTVKGSATAKSSDSEMTGKNGE